MKEGWKTTEFWIAMLVLGIVGALLIIQAIRTGSISGAWELIAAAVTAVGYGVSRGIAKSSSSRSGSSSSP